MSSILTNTSAMVALQTLKSINSNLTKVQNEISTGKTVATAKDNSSIWAISKVMESDVKGFTGISESLDLASSALGVARDATESIQTSLTEIKAKIVAAQAPTSDREKLQTDIANYVNQIKTITNAAQFYGLNLLQGTESIAALASLDRDPSGGVTATSIDVARQDMTTTAGVYGTAGSSLNANMSISGGLYTVDVGATDGLSADGNTAVLTMGTGAYTATSALTLNVGGVEVRFAAGELVAADEDGAAAIVAARINSLGIEGVTAAVSGADITLTSTRAFETAEIAVASQTATPANAQITALGATTGLTLASATIEQRAESVGFLVGAAVTEGDGYRVTFGGQQFTYVAGPDETFEDVAEGLKIAIDSAKIEGISTKVVQDATSGQWQLLIDNDSTTDYTLGSVGTTGGEASGGLFGLDSLNVLTSDSAAAALTNIETLITRAIDSAASFGSAQIRIESQVDFIGKLTDALKTGIGTMVDADLEEASARLQALQVQQQLGIQALSIANSAPQSILSLFK